MADFCKQCSIDHFGKDFGDLAGITPQEDWDAGKAMVVLCEGCGAIQVMPDGTCCGGCMERHAEVEFNEYKEGE